MFRINLPGNLKTKKIILAVLIVVCTGILIKVSIDNKDKSKDSKINTNVETKLESK